MSAGNIGGLITDKASVEASRPFLALWDDTDPPEKATRGSVALGASGGSRAGASIGIGEHWSVAMSGVVDAIGGEPVTSDPAGAIARAFDRSGIEAARAVAGEYSCLATDGRRLIAFKDHIGSHGLFAATGPDGTVIADGPRQVAEAVDGTARPDVDALAAVFFSQVGPEEELPVPYAGVDRVPRGFVVEASVGGWRRGERLWDPSHLLETAELDVTQAVERGWDLLCSAVDRCTDGPTAVSLSGGVDSTLVAAALASLGRTGVGAISAVYPDSPSVDESGYIAETTEMLGLTGTTYVPDGSRIANLDLWVRRCGEPTQSLALGPLESMNRVAGEHGYSTVLSGEMGEVVYDANRHVVGRILGRGKLSTGWRHLSQHHESGRAWWSLARMAAAALIPTGIAVPRSSAGASWKIDWVAPADAPPAGSPRAVSKSIGGKWRDLQLAAALGPSFPGLELSTVVGAHFGVRTRRPLLDRDLWEFFISLPAEVKFPDAWTKSLARRILDGRAPDVVTWRTDKTYFDEDAERNAEYAQLRRRLGNGFELPGVVYPKLLARLGEGEMTITELARARHLASIHAFMEQAS